MADSQYNLGKDVDIDFNILSFRNKHYLKNFSCGNPEIDRYFHRQALDDNDTVTYMFIDKKLDIAIALVSISCSRIDYWQNKKYMDYTPAVEIKFFATEEKYHNLPFEHENDSKTLSKVIMAKMICFIYDEICTRVGASKIILNSVERAINFYKSCFFQIYDGNMDVDYGCVNDNLTPMYYNLLPE